MNTFNLMEQYRMLTPLNSVKVVLPAQALLSSACWPHASQ